MIRCNVLDMCYVRCYVYIKRNEIPDRRER